MPLPIGLGSTLPPGSPGGGGPINYMANLGSAGRVAGGQGVLPGSPPYNYSPSFGGIPGVPAPSQSAGQAIGGNIGNLGQIYNLGGPLNQFTAQQAPTSLNLNLPHYQQSLATQSGDVLSKLQGQIPQDVKNQLAQFGAERGVQTGSIGSPNSNAALMSLFGTNSLALQNQGMQQFGQEIAQTPQGQQFNPFGFLVSPQEQQAAQYQANLLNAAPVPSAAQYANLNALQQGRGAGYSGFPSSAPTSAPFQSQYSPGQQPLGGISPPSGTQGYASQYGQPLGPPNSFQPGDFEAMFGDQFDPSQSQGYNGMDFTSDLDFGNLFGDAGG